MRCLIWDSCKNGQRCRIPTKKAARAILALGSLLGHISRRCCDGLDQSRLPIQSLLRHSINALLQAVPQSTEFPLDSFHGYSQGLTAGKLGGEAASEVFILLDRHFPVNVNFTVLKLGRHGVCILSRIAGPSTAVLPVAPAKPQEHFDGSFQ